MLKVFDNDRQPLSEEFIFLIKRELKHRFGDEWEKRFKERQENSIFNSSKKDKKHEAVIIDMSVMEIDGSKIMGYIREHASFPIGLIENEMGKILEQAWNNNEEHSRELFHGSLRVGLDQCGLLISETHLAEVVDLLIKALGEFYDMTEREVEG